MSRLKRSVRRDESIILETSNGPIVITLLASRGSTSIKEKAELGIDAPLSVRISYKNFTVPREEPIR